ncbi:MAG: hypothetical protein H2174_01365 [Vampirovibrio sp.]|nr:hypothetical protein [Vampirovibrio sp.]
MSSISSGNFNAMPFNNNGVNTQFNNNQLSKDQTPAGIPRKAQAEEGDTFTPMATPTDKSVFPIASTLVGGGTGLFVGGLGSAFVPLNQPTELKVKAGKTDVVTIEGDKVMHDGYTYTMEKADGKYKVKDIVGEIKVGDKEWNHFVKSPHEGQLLTRFIEAGSDITLKQGSMDALAINAGEKFGVHTDKNSVQVSSTKETIAFNVVKDADGKMVLKESDHLLGLIKDDTKPHINPTNVEELKKMLMSDQVKAMDAFDKFKGLKNPEGIENLLHGAGRKVGWIAALTAATVAAGAWIGYSVGNKKPQPQP